LTAHFKLKEYARSRVSDLLKRRHEGYSRRDNKSSKTKNPSASWQKGYVTVMKERYIVEG